MGTLLLQATDDTSAAGNDQCCGQIGGDFGLPDGTTWPRCSLCDSELIAYLEIVIPDSGASPFNAGSRLQVLGCRSHSDIPGTIYSDYEPFEIASEKNKLPQQYWDITDGHYLLRLLPPSTICTSVRAEPQLVQQYIEAMKSDSDGEDGFKLFGQPFWFQESEEHTCSCGAAMKLLLQLPEQYGFIKSESAEEQADSFSADEYCLFLGNQLYLLACVEQCDPQAIWPVVQG